MAYFEFLWTPESIEHVEANDVTIEDFEYVVRNPDRMGSSYSSGRPCAFGFTLDGRRIICIYEMLNELQVLPVTAFPIEDNDIDGR